MSWETIETRIKAEYPVIKAWMALHPYSSAFIAFALGAVIGHII